MFQKPKAKQSREENKPLLDATKGQPCVVCGFPHTDPAHIKSFGSGGLSGASDIIPLCRMHHSLQHSKGWAYMCESFPQLQHALRTRGWDFVDVFGVKKLQKI